MVSPVGTETNTVQTKEVYTDIYKADGHNYGGYTEGQLDTFRTDYLLSIVAKYIDLLKLQDAEVVVEIGAGLGQLNVSHKNWKGYEYSATAVALAKKIYGPLLNIIEADARALPQASGSVNFAFTFATFEHIPDVENAFAEIERIMAPGGIALIAPAWNCRPWTVKKLEQRPYSDLSLTEKIGKFLIPVRNNMLVRIVAAMPMRSVREIKLLSGKEIQLDYKKLEPDFSLWDKYPHISDDDAFVSLDAHAALVYFASKKWEILSHSGFLSRIMCRGHEIVVRKPV